MSISTLLTGALATGGDSSDDHQHESSAQAFA